jgi:GT2 family glycosyltransferase
VAELPEVSIVIVSWNTRQMLLDALRTFLPMRGFAGETIVVDNDSKDGSAEAVEQHWPGVRVIRNPRNLGFAGGVNVGLRAATRPLVLLLNTDTLVVGDAIPRLLAYAAAHPEAGIIGPRVMNRDGTLQTSVWRFPSLRNMLLSSTYLYKLFARSAWANRERMAGVDLSTPRPVDAVSGCCFLIRRQVLDQVGYLDEGYFMYAEETDLCLRAQRAGFQVHYAPVGEIVHFGGGSSRLQSRRCFLEYRRSMLRFFRKHHGRFAANCVRILLLVFLLVRTPYWALRSLIPDHLQREARARLGHHVAGIRFLLSGASTLRTS